jgi:cytochrome c biogenesis protein CcdA
MWWLQTVLENTNMPWVAAFILGLLTALSPCPLATNITAVGVIGKEIENPKRVFVHGLLYTFGRAFTYTLLGAILIFLLRGGSSVFGIQKFVGKYGEMFLPYLLIVIGLCIVFDEKIKLPSFGYKGDGDNLKQRGGWGAFLIGVIFALAFCPTSGVFYFGMLIPLSVTAAGGYFLPIIFAVATSLPVIIVAWIIAFSVNKIGDFYSKMKSFQKWFYLIVGVLCIGVGIYYLVMRFI